MNGPGPSLPYTLQQARKAQRLSQLELSLRVGVSQRHVSFVESGRARPSRALLDAWLRELEAPLALRNAAMLQAGFAPLYGSATLDDASLAQARHALVQLMRAHDPLPALVIDSRWNLLLSNRGCKWLVSALMPGADALPDDASVNLLDVLADPQGLTNAILNLEEVGPALLTQLRHEALVQPALMPKVEALAALLRDRLGADRQPRPGSIAPVLTTRYASPYGELAFFSMFTTFGTPQDITLASLRVEHLFAADEATRAVMNAHVGPAAGRP